MNEQDLSQGSDALAVWQHRVRALFADTDGWLCDTDDDSVADSDWSLVVACNDCFGWGMADSEPIMPEDFAALWQARADAAGSPWWPLVWVARKRGMRPQGALLREIAPDDPALPHLLAAGPPRPVTFGNPIDFPAGGEGCEPSA